MSVVQTATNAGSGTSITATFASNVTNLDAVVVVAFYSGAVANPGFTITDSQGNTYSSITVANINANEKFEAFVAPNCAAGATTVTFTCGFTGGLMLAILECSSIVTSSPIDVYASGNGATPVSLSISPTSTDVLFAFSIGSGNSLSAGITGSGWVPEISLGSTTLLSGWVQAGVSSTVNPSLSITNVNGAGMAAILFGLKQMGTGCTPSLGALSATTFTTGTNSLARATVSGCNPLYCVSVVSGSLPPGMELSVTQAYSGNYLVLSGIPTTNNTYNFTAEVVDSTGNAVTQAYSVTVTGSNINSPSGSITAVKLYVTYDVTNALVTTLFGASLVCPAAVAAPAGIPMLCSAAFGCLALGGGGVNNPVGDVVEGGTCSAGSTNPNTPTGGTGKAGVQCSLDVTTAFNNSGLTLTQFEQLLTVGVGSTGVIPGWDSGNSSAAYANGFMLIVLDVAMAVTYANGAIVISRPSWMVPEVFSPVNGTVLALAGPPSPCGTVVLGTAIFQHRMSTVEFNPFALFGGFTTPGSAGCGSLPTGLVGYPYTGILSGSPPFSLVSGSLPPGLSLDSASGVISGVPTTAGTYTFTVSANGNHTTCSITICNFTQRGNIDYDQIGIDARQGGTVGSRLQYFTGTFTPGNVATWDDCGNLIDSGVSIASL